MEFEELEALRRRLRELKRLQSKSLSQYFSLPPRGGPSSAGFRHLWDITTAGGKKYSHASTATCIVSLTNTGGWWDEKNTVNGMQWREYTAPILRQFCTKKPARWESAGLDPGNAFTVAFTLEGLHALYDRAKDDLPQKLQRKVEVAIDGATARLLEVLKADKDNRSNRFGQPGSANLPDYPPTTFLTQLVVRAIGPKRLSRAPATKNKVVSWCSKQIEHELALLSSGSNAADPLALAYAVSAFLCLADSGNLSPTDTKMVVRAVDFIFESQLPDGLWPRSRPLHHYPKFGNAYCYEYETLAQLLQIPYLETQLITKLENLEKAVSALDRTANNLPEGGKGWPSGHHPHIQGAESWSTASVYQFLHQLDRLVAEAIRRVTFAHVGSLYTKPLEINTGTTRFNPKPFLDSDFTARGHRPRSLRATIESDLLQPILKEVHRIKRGEKLPDSINISAILFGPPGTSKTQLAKFIATHLGWPKLDIDPSHLFRAGLEQLQSESNVLFNMLAALERAVVFFDEFDEMVRERTSVKADLMSRFLTTAMLPKLSRIADERKIVFLLATNHIEDFDFAISRPGRFDMILPVMPPSLQAKLKNHEWSRLAKKLQPILDDPVYMENGESLPCRKVISALTYAEYKALNTTTSRLRGSKALIKAISNAWARATLGGRQVVDCEPRLMADLYEEQCLRFTRLRLAE